MRRKLLVGLLAVSLVLSLYGTNNTIIGSCIYLISRETTGAERWEPSSAVTTQAWATSWGELKPVPGSYVARWAGQGPWGSTTPLQVNGLNTGDIYLAFDSAYNSGQGRFVLAAMDLTTAPSIWFGYSTDASGGQWAFRQNAVMASSTTVSDNSTTTVTWDFPSIGVDASGRIIVGAARIQTITTQIPGQPPLITTTYDFRVVVSTNNGGTFSDPPVLVPGTTDLGASNHLSRVVATDNEFHVFVQAQIDAFSRNLNRYHSSDGMTWIGPETLVTFSNPKAYSQPFYRWGYWDGCPDPKRSCSCTNVPPTQTCGPIFYGPNVDARGYKNGLWTVAIQIAVPYSGIPYNNIYIYMSSRGGGLVNAFPNDQFLAGTSVSGDGGYWVALHTFSSVDPPPSPYGVLPLITQALYFYPPPLPSPDRIGVTTHFNVNPKAWYYSKPTDLGYRCPLALPGCYGSGDYAGIASNPSHYASTPFVAQAPPSRPTHNDLYQRFLLEPPAQTPSANSFVPNFIPYPIGADLRIVGQAVPVVPAPLTTAFHAIATGRNWFPAP